MTCAKKIVICRLVLPSGRQFHGENSCENPQDKCPRSPGEDYTKCREICRQQGHAEIMAIEEARLAKANTVGATAIIQGHYRICDDCARALRDAGVFKIVIETGA